MQASIYYAFRSMSDFESKMGAANLAQVSSSEVIMPASRWLTCPDVDQQAPYPTVCAIRTEELGQSGLSATSTRPVPAPESNAPGL